jgi:hypothetical protein
MTPVDRISYPVYTLHATFFDLQHRVQKASLDNPDCTVMHLNHSSPNEGFTVPWTPIINLVNLFIL